MVPLALIAREYLLLGLTGFGGALHARFHHLAVEKHDWLHEDDFGEVVATASLSPGANSSNVGAEIARRLRGRLGMAVAYPALLLPGLVFVLVGEHLWRIHREDPAVAGAMRGLEAAAVAMILYAATRLSRRGWRIADWLVALAALLSLLVGKWPLWLVLPGLGLLNYLRVRRRS
jgi:chromate transporter